MIQALSRLAALAASALLAGMVPGAVPPASVQATAPVENKTCKPVSKSEGEQYSAGQLAKLAKDTGFTGDGLVNAVAVALAESSGFTKALLVNENCTRDRGLWQINDYWHPEVSEQQAFDPAQNAKAAFDISDQGTRWDQWSTWESGAYKDYLPDAEQAVRNPA
ncbi:hypothetical protein [Kutzneria kofuensis]|uniref:Transglycosylase SLT domain-containing protein n=1 Tax=Kutzneria kofuensis TaxID=103725 RepID=A0A7W9NHT5_9PSEU|nr:hypothetical protein [Kutzneria kofuensis]MBB5893872.1 hypothetical protein [Kutzneria kofuensis]